MPVFKIEVDIRLEIAADKLHLTEEQTREADFTSILEEVQSIAEPKAVWEHCHVQEVGEGLVVIDGSRFHSNVLACVLSESDSVFPFVMTIGDAVEKRARRVDDSLQQYCYEYLGDFVLLQASQRLQQHLQLLSGSSTLSWYNPGSVDDFKLEGQRDLFRLLGDVRERIGVKLQENLIMYPRKSISGLYFKSEEPFYSCQICEREKCIGRRAPYDRSIAENFGVE